jgi:hypothetical protein
MPGVKPSLRVLAAGLIAVGVTIDIVLAVAGHMHRHAHRPMWASVLSWLFIVCFFSLGGIGVIALRRFFRDRSTGPAPPPD